MTFYFVFTCGGKHHHPTMTDPGIIPGNGLILYFKTGNTDAILQ